MRTSAGAGATAAGWGTGTFSRSFCWLPASERKRLWSEWLLEERGDTLTLKEEVVASVTNMFTLSFEDSAFSLSKYKGSEYVTMENSGKSLPHRCLRFRCCIPSRHCQRHTWPMRKNEENTKKHGGMDHLAFNLGNFADVRAHNVGSVLAVGWREHLESPVLVLANVNRDRLHNKQMSDLYIQLWGFKHVLGFRAWSKQWQQLGEGEWLWRKNCDEKLVSKKNLGKGYHHSCQARLALQTTHRRSSCLINNDK